MFCKHCAQELIREPPDPNIVHDRGWRVQWPGVEGITFVGCQGRSDRDASPLHEPDLPISMARIDVEKWLRVDKRRLSPMSGD